MRSWIAVLLAAHFAAPPPELHASDIHSLVVESSCSSYLWKDRGLAPLGYLKGVATVFARALCRSTQPEHQLVSKANSNHSTRDALAWYAPEFATLGMSNDQPGLDTLRHSYTLLIGLGIAESSGQYCLGRDLTGKNQSSSTAEAGAWQTSWDSHTAHQELENLFKHYRSRSKQSRGCELQTFQEEVSCSPAEWKDWGTERDGLEFQRTQKICPAFATEYAAILLRLQGGSLGHFGPLRKKTAELRPECDAMLRKVQELFQKNPQLCSELLQDHANLSE